MIQDELHERFSALTYLEQAVLSTFATYAESISKSRIRVILAAVGIHEDTGRQFTTKAIGNAIDSLQKTGLLSPVTQTDPGLTNRNGGLLVEAHAAGFLAPIAEDMERNRRSSYQSNYGYSWNSVGEKHRLRRMAAMGDADGITRLLERYKDPIDKEVFQPDDHRFSFLTFPGDGLIFPHLPEEYRSQVLTASLPCLVAALAPVDGFLAPVIEDPGAFSIEAVSVVAETCILRGDFTDAVDLARSLLSRDEPGAISSATVLHAWLATATGEFAAARWSFEQSVAAILAGTRKRKAYPGGFASAFALLSFSEEGAIEGLQAAKETAKFGKRSAPSFYQHPAGLFLDALDARTGSGSPYATEIDYPARSPLFNWLRCYRQVWFGSEEPMSAQNEKGLAEASAAAIESGFNWVAYEIETLRSRVSQSAKQQAASAKLASTLAKEIGTSASILDCVPIVAPWERHLSGLESLARSTSPVSSSLSDSPTGPRLAWIIVYSDAPKESFRDMVSELLGNRDLNNMIEHFELEEGEDDENGSIIDLIAIQQNPTRKGWTKGKEISERRLSNSPESFPFLSPQDERAIATIQITSRGWYSNAHDYEFDIPAALHALAGHPAVFERHDDRSDTHTAEITAATPEIHVAPDSEGNVIATLTPSTPTNGAYRIERNNSGRYTATQFTQEHLNIAEALTASGLRVPAEAAPRLSTALAGLATSVQVRSEGEALQAVDSAAAETVPSDPAPMIRIVPVHPGIEAQLCVQPILGAEIFLAPGIGGATLMANAEGRVVQTTRDLTSESDAASALLTACPALASHQSATDPLPTFHLPSTAEALEALVQLKASDARLVWPKGEPYSVAGEADTSALQVTVKKAKDWFAASAELVIDADLVLDTKRLLALLDEPGTGRFIEISEGKFLALTNALRRQLDELRILGTPSRDKASVQLHPLATGIFHDTFDAAGKLSADKAWKDQVKRFESASAVSPKLPKTLQAELRPYQEEGFQWLSQLAALGAGACLADDMGLGKTVQTLALLLSRTKGGPALVVAPTSVVPNWAAEARRFAPTLQVISYTGNRNERDGLLDKLKPAALVIVSYALLQIDSELFSKTTWHTVVLDEAQAIKNASTKRAKAALQLNADFRIATTGTPVENRLDELFSLFAFLNPGLLGSRERFSKIFATPIERDGDPTSRSRLKTLISPFILRRLKSAVLDDLPARTEMTLHIEMAPEEAAFYEGLRQRAVESLEKDSTEEDPNKNSLQILAEIMKLRRACCSPVLAVKGKAKAAAPEGSKLAAFGSLVEELLAGGHRALVFSQFVDHLKILEAHLKKEGISYQYLDGSTPAKQREKKVATFQAGEGDIFLISLKAGGTGLNLTGADYVIHMDPWWNPAVEDQASDRAHRIGQTRPVTVYRMVMKGTIEEQIVALHHKKRDLADSLLEGTDTAARLTPKDMLKLIQLG